MSFMQQQVTRKLDWYEIDGNEGITFVPVEDVGKPDLDGIEDADEREDALKDFVQDYYAGREIFSVQITTGFGARLSAPGYMDCTDWAVFDTAEEAQAYLDETYGDEDEDEDDE
jgi:hypothetical protein